jgi:type I restriction enzyme M protein
MVHRPSWFRDGYVFISYAPTVGLNKDGQELYVVDPATGTRTSVIDDRLLEDVKAVLDRNATTDTSRWVEESALGDRQQAVPVYFDLRQIQHFEDLMATTEFEGFQSATLGELIDDGLIIAKNGHGSPSSDLRSGTVPYIKVSDLRAGQVNINPTNRVPEVVAQRHWRGGESGLAAFDLLTPIRTSKNIGDFSVLMPGQERLVLTKEILVLRAATESEFDNFYLLWAMSLRAVRRQWDRIVFMQTNREDVGSRYRQIRVPVANKMRMDEVSKPFRDYYVGVQALRETFLQHLSQDDKFHIFLSSSEAVEEEIEETRDDERGLGAAVLGDG